MKFNKTAVKYCVEITIDEFSILMDKEAGYEQDDSWKSLCLELGKMDGIEDVDYNGHFGPNIFYTHDLRYPVAQKQITKVIEKWIKEDE